MNILLIDHYAGSLKHGMEYRPYYLAREWVKAGHQVNIFAASYSHVRTVQPELSGSYMCEEIDGIRYSWFKTPAYENNGVKRVINILIFVFQIFFHQKKQLIRNKPDLVIASSTYPLDILPAHWIARQAGARLVFEVHDLWPLSPVELGGMSPKHPWIMLLQWAEDYAYQHANCVVSMLPLAESYMREHGLAKGKFIYIPNGVDLIEWEGENEPLPDEHLQVISQLRRTGSFLVAYAGSHGLANALNVFIEAALLLKDQPVAFIFVGQGPEKNRLKEFAKQKNLKNVFFLPTVSKASIPALLMSMDVLYIGLKSEPLFRFGVSPNKLLDYMMAAKPVIHAIDAGNDLVAESGCGISVPPEDPFAIAEAIKKLMNLTDSDRESMGLQGREFILRNHDYRVLASHFLSNI